MTLEVDTYNIKSNMKTNKNGTITPLFVFKEAMYYAGKFGRTDEEGPWPDLLTRMYEADLWLSKIELIIETYGIIGTARLTFARMNLIGQPSRWLTHLKSESNSSDKPTWSEFVKLFRKEYCCYHELDQRLNHFAFLELKCTKDMRVAEFNEKFDMHLYLMGDNLPEKYLISNYILKLPFYIRKKVQFEKFSTLRSVMHAALLEESMKVFYGNQNDMNYVNNNDDDNRFKASRNYRRRNRRSRGGRARRYRPYNNSNNEFHG